ncbi:MAG: PQQ-binding-like beta-propeller repeat protein [Candidatus Bathyarchaeota archaeon]|nr:MAG: PQQ-binding-like beta-propeller repeat protein [Candidatus Bathyarchaeum tardum]WNZ29868.1 MAG: PQQ-binding-like beta-propeller repeat protein [Candidatus Bathyarchaeota archaeon]
MKKTNYSYLIGLLLLVTLLVVESVAVFPADSSVTSNSTNDDFLQYEWPQIHGDSAFTRFSEGTAPETTQILWKTTIEGIQSYITAFNGKVLVTTTTSVIALDKDTGTIIWNTTFPNSQRWPAVFKIDDERLVVGPYCVQTETGEILWTSDKFSAKVSYWSESVYSPEEKMFYVHGDSVVEAWDFSNPSEPPTLAWETYISGSTSSGTGIQYGDGKVFPGTFETYQIALNARTGDVLWETETNSAMSFSGSYYEGKLLKAGEQDNTFYCFDAETGQILWKYNPGSHLGYWISGSAVAYDIVYELNKDGNLYALDVNTGQLVWKYEGPGYLFWPGWPVVADGKVYATTGQRASYDPYTLEYSKSEFVCLDAFTGEVIWEMDIETHCPRDSIAVAYGNLYIIPGFIKEMTMDQYETYNQVWAIGGTSESWSMWRNDSENTGASELGPSELNLRWSFETNGGVGSTPVIADDRVYFGSQDKNVYCVDANDGRFYWSFATEARIKSSLAVSNGKVYVGPDDGYVYCLDAISGRLIWKTYAGGFVEAAFKAVTGIRSSPIVLGNRVYVGSLDANLYCFNADNGDVVWAYETGGYITASPAASKGAIYITSMESSSGALYKIDADDGSLVWKCDIPYVVVQDRGTDMHASPTVGDGLVFVAANKQNYYGINVETGEIEWTYVTTEGTEGIGGYLIASPAYYEGQVYVVDMFFITALDANNGEVIWKSWIGTELYTTPTYGGGNIYVTTDRRFVYVLNATDGYRLGFFDTNSNSWSAPSVYEGQVYFGCNDGKVYCVDGKTTILGQIYVEFDKNTVEKGNTLTACGQLEPAIAYTPVKVTVTNPNGDTQTMEIIAQNDGTFSFECKPDINGEWTATIRCSGPTYIMQTEERAFTVTDEQETIETEQPSTPEEQQDQTSQSQDSIMPLDNITLIAGIIIVAAVAIIIGYMFVRKRKKGSPVAIMG